MKRFFGILIILLILAVLPKVLGTYYVTLVTQMLISAIFAISLDLLIGYLDLPSLGHAAFFGVAAYTMGILFKKGVNHFWLNFPLGIAVAVAVAALFGLLVLRTRGAYFFMITVALAEVLWGIAFSWRFMTGGDDGIPGISRPSLGFIPFSLGGVTNYYYFVLFFFLVSFLFIYIIVHSPFGHVIVGIRENELRMRALGYNTWPYKYICFILSGLFAGVAGGLSVYFKGFVSPSDLAVTLSAEGLLMVLLGGAGTLFGPVIGAGCIIFLEHFISAYTERWLLLLGIIYILVVMFAPQGILGLTRSRTTKAG